MTWSIDARIPLLVLPPDDLAALQAGASPPLARIALLIPQALGGFQTGELPFAHFEPDGPRHAAACACCAGRPPVSAALDRLFQARVRGTCPWFDSVVALVRDDACRAEVTTALLNDPLTSARFRAG